jgi:hypothetical protein
LRLNPIYGILNFCEVSLGARFKENERPPLRLEIPEETGEITLA